MCPTVWTARQGCSWGPYLGGSHRMKEQATGLSHLCPSREKSPNVPGRQHPGSYSSWEQHKVRALGKWLVSAQGHGDFVQGLVTEHAPLQTGRWWALWGLWEVSAEKTLHFALSLWTCCSVHKLLAPACTLLQVASKSQSSESSLAPLHWFRPSSSFSLLLWLPPILFPSDHSPWVNWLWYSFKTFNGSPLPSEWVQTPYSSTQFSSNSPFPLVNKPNHLLIPT